MAQITSREELEAWLKEKPADWAQVIAARAALRVLTYAFMKRVPDDWVLRYSLVVFRANAAVGSVGAAFAAGAAVSDAIGAARPAYTVALAILSAATAATEQDEYAVGSAVEHAAFGAARAGASAFAAVWANTSHDCSWLISEDDLAFASHRLRSVALWPASLPEGWHKAWTFATIRLLALDPTYQVWIDWYNRRVEGHDAAFDIPGDIDRTHDKAILARLTDATDADFWGKGATYVNTTLQSWIDEARLTAELESIVRRLEGGAATQFASPEARETLAALRAKLEAALGNQAPAHAPIGHNHPPEGIDPAEAPILPPAIREEARAMLVMIDQPTPDALAVATTLTRWSKFKSTFQHDEFSKNFSGELGTSVARGIVFILTTLCLLGLAWLKAILGI